MHKKRVISARKMMSFTQNYWGQRDIISQIKYEQNEVQIRYIPELQKNIRSIHQQQYSNMRMFWRK